MNIDISCLLRLRFAVLIELLLWPNFLTKDVFPEPPFRLSELIGRMFMCGHRKDLVQFFESEGLCFGNEEKDQPPSDEIPCSIPIECTRNCECIAQGRPGD